MSTLDGIIASGGSGGAGGSGDVVGPASATDNAIARFDTGTGKLLQNSDVTISDLAAGAVTITAGKGTAITLKNTNPDATTGASVAGDPLAFTAGDAVASTDTDGAAAGGALTLTSGNAARRTSGNAAGGDLVITPGEPIGTGVPGRIWLNYATAASDQVYATPRLVLNRLANTGFGAYESANLISFVGGNPYINLKANDTSVTLLSGIVLNFGAPSLTTNGDVGLARSAAGIVKVTDGGAGLGKLFASRLYLSGLTGSDPSIVESAVTAGDLAVVSGDDSVYVPIRAERYKFSGTAAEFQLFSNVIYSKSDSGFAVNNATGTEMRWIHASVEVEANTAGVGTPNAISATESLKVFTNEGVTAKNYEALPTAAAGYQFTFIVQDADGMRIVANTGDTIRVIDKVTAAAGYIESTTIGSVVTLIAINATEWIATSIHGTWTDGTFTYDDTSLTTP